MDGNTDLATAVSSPGALAFDASDLEGLLFRLAELRADMVDSARTRLTGYEQYYPEGRFTPSAWNLAQYLSLRSHELRPLQHQLADNALSSLGRSEAHILDTFNKLIRTLGRAVGVAEFGDVTDVPAVTYSLGERLLQEHTDEIFGTPTPQRAVRIMVTLPSEAATNLALITQLLVRGMDCARINCAHDDRETWQAMIENLRRAEQQTGKPCRVLMDLAGHKIRTGPLHSEQAVLHIKPQKNHLGWITRQALVLLEDAEPSPLAAIPRLQNRFRLQIPAALIDRLAAGDRLTFDDARGKERNLNVLYRDSDRRWVAQSPKSAFITPDTAIHHLDRDGNEIPTTGKPYRFNDIPLRNTNIRVYEGDPLMLCRDGKAGTPAILNEQDEIVTPARITCSSPQALDSLMPGHAVWIDDGKIGTEVEEIVAEGALLRVTHVGPNGARIKADKGLNFPDSRLELPALSEKDLRDLDFVARHADLVGFSFVQCLNDMNCLINELKARDAAHLPIAAKIETRRAVVNFPDIVLGTLGRHPLAVMIARGDLAVELGGERMVEIQEELLWLCEAAHVPVIWATQVLETLTKKGVASRPELTDAAMGERAECVMLNKGRYILEAVDMLDGILTRMRAHQRKKRSQLRALHW